MNQRGFTLVELLLAMSIFSLAMVTVSAGVIKMYHLFQAGGEVRATQQSARYSAEVLSRDARDAKRIAVIGGTFGEACFFTEIQETGLRHKLDGTKYFVQQNGDRGNLMVLRNNAVIVDDLTQATLNSACDDVGGTAQRVSSDDTSVEMFDVASSQPAQGLFGARLAIASVNGLADIRLDPTLGAICPGEGEDQRYCSVTNLQFAAGIRESAR